MVNLKDTTVTVLLTCFNRKNKTEHAVKQLLKNEAEVDFIIVDDGSTDGTREAIEALPANVDYIMGNGNYYWCGGMRVAVDAYFTRKTKSDYVLFVNDDVDFRDNTIDFLLQDGIDDNTVIVGCTSDKNGKLSYGGVRSKGKIINIEAEYVGPNISNRLISTFNANCVLLKSNIVEKAGNFDTHFSHSLGDWDYGFRITKLGYKIIVSSEYVGKCNKNPIDGTWEDQSLSLLNRLKKKESIKGSPFKQWFYYLYKNYNFLIAFRYSCTPYLKILISSFKSIKSR